MLSPAPERGPLTRGERWTFSVFLALILGLFSADLITNYSPAKLGGFLVILFWIPLLATHEAGHALAARLLGWHVGSVVLGFGRTWKRIHLGSTLVEVRSFPLTGFVKCVPTHLRQPRLRNALVYFAGPGTDLLVAASVIVLVGPGRLLTPSLDYGTIALQSLTLAGLAQGAMNLIPFSSGTAGNETASDGLGIIQSMTLPTEHFTEQIEAFRQLGADYFEDHPPVTEPEEWWKRDRRL